MNPKPLQNIILKDPYHGKLNFLQFFKIAEFNIACKVVAQFENVSLPLQNRSCKAFLRKILQYCHKDETSMCCPIRPSLYISRRHSGTRGVTCNTIESLGIVYI